MPTAVPGIQQVLSKYLWNEDVSRWNGKWCENYFTLLLSDPKVQFYKKFNWSGILAGAAPLIDTKHVGAGDLRPLLTPPQHSPQEPTGPTRQAPAAASSASACVDRLPR